MSNLSHSNFSFTGVLNIANTMLNIEKMDISNNFITTDNIVVLATALSKCLVLTYLKLAEAY